MRFREFKSSFVSDLLSGQDIEQSRWHGIVPAHVLQRWHARLYRANRPAQLPAQLRLLNHFCLGADPEFSMLSADGHHYIMADACSMKAGLAIGADNNGRLVELRPMPHRSALYVVASILAELRWGLHFYPETQGLTWITGPYDKQDGLGGHVHFGRKQVALRKAEVLALDLIYKLTIQAGVFDKAMTNARISSNHGGAYGRPGDIRPQKHGYEYRSLPSWLDSPWNAFLSIVLSKLAVCAPDAVTQLCVSHTVIARMDSAAARKTIRNLLARFKGQDDDALFAYLALDVWGLPQPIGLKDFKSNWGLLGPAYGQLAMPAYLAPAIPPEYVEASPQDVQEVYRYLLYGQKPPFRWPSAPSWEFQHVPAGFTALITHVNTRLSPGIGELVQDLLTPKSIDIKFVYQGNEHKEMPPSIYVAAGMSKLYDTRALSKQYPPFKWLYTGLGGHAIGFNKEALKHPRLKEVVQQAFPVVQYRKLDKWDGARWEAAIAKAANAGRQKSVILYNGSTPE